MLRLFQSIFGDGGSEQGQIHETLIQGASECAVDGIDSRVRVVPGYRKRLREPVILSNEHIVTLVAPVSPPRRYSPDVAATRMIRADIA